MTDVRQFEEMRGEFIRIKDINARFYIPDKDEQEVLRSTAEAMRLAEELPAYLPDEEVSDWEILAIEGRFEDQELDTPTGLLAVHLDSDRAITSEDGVITILDTPFTGLQVELDVREAS